MKKGKKLRLLKKLIDVKGLFRYAPRKINSKIFFSSQEDIKQSRFDAAINISKEDLRACEAAVWTFILTAEESAFLTSPYSYLSTVWAWKLRCISARWDYPIT